MNDKPVGRRTYDTIENTVTPWVDAGLHASQFARTTAVVARAWRRFSDQLNCLAAWVVLHLFNLPAHTDIDSLHSQVGAVDREVRRVSAEFDHQARQQD
jgi:hypothetical protein